MLAGDGADTQLFARRIDWNSNGGDLRLFNSALAVCDVGVHQLIIAELLLATTRAAVERPDRLHRLPRNFDVSLTW